MRPRVLPALAGLAILMAVGCASDDSGISPGVDAGPTGADAGDAGAAGADGDIVPPLDGGIGEGEAIVFQAEVDGPWRLYRVDLQGDSLGPAIAGSARGIEPAVRGGRVVFTRPVDGLATVHAADLGGDAEALTESDESEANPTLSPDGETLVFSRLVDDIPKLFIAEADASNAERLTADFGSNDTLENAPSFSPEGDEVVFSATPAGVPDLFVADVATGETRLLHGEDRTLIEPAWDPEGGRVAFAAAEVGSSADLYVFDMEGETAEAVVTGAGSYAQPAWLEGGEIAFSASEDGEREIRVVDPEAPGEVRTLDTGELPARAPAAIR